MQILAECMDNSVYTYLDIFRGETRGLLGGGGYSFTLVLSD